MSGHITIKVIMLMLIITACIKTMIALHGHGHFMTEWDMILQINVSYEPS